MQAAVSTLPRNDAMADSDDNALTPTTAGLGAHVGHMHLASFSASSSGDGVGTARLGLVGAAATPASPSTLEEADREPAESTSVLGVAQVPGARPAASYTKGDDSRPGCAA